MDNVEQKSLDMLCINAIRALSIDAVQKANSGHPGLPLGGAPMAYVLWKNHLKYNPANPRWYDRDRFILSAGHGSMLLYSLLYLTGYPVSLDEIKHFRQLGSITPGHPESELTPGVEVTSGPLGQGFANGVGMAIAEANLSARYNRPGYQLIDHFTYGIVSDGDLMEGVASEAASLAGHLKLGKLIYLYDNNCITLSGATQLTFTENCAQRFEAYGWQVQVIEDGNDLVAIDRALKTAKKDTERPSLIVVRTHIGYGSPHKHDTFEVHGAPLGEEEVKLTKQQLGWPLEPDFYVPDQVRKHFREAVARGERAEKEWQTLFQAYEKENPQSAKEFRQLMRAELPDGWDKNIPEFPADPVGMATRMAGSKVLQAICPNLPGLLGGSADLNSSTYTAMVDFGNFQSEKRERGDTQGAERGGFNYSGRNIFYGVREHAMGAISNGLATFEGLLPYTATFLIFSDYMRPPMRLAAMAQVKVIYIFTHDSIGLGEDGPTHQPVEQLANLRAIPNLVVIRPSDANETAVAWRVAIEMKNRPVALILSRQTLPILDRQQFPSARGLFKGAYILSDPPNQKPEIILMATGSEVSLIVEAKQTLQQQGVGVRLVSMPSWELFERQPKAYKEFIFPPHVTNRLAVEAGVSQGWERYIGEKGKMISLETFGASAPGKKVMGHFGFTAENVCQHALSLIEREKQIKKGEGGNQHKAA
jgi:transketolase